MAKEQRLLLYFCLAKISIVYFLIYLFHTFFNFNLSNYALNFTYPPGDPISLKSSFLTWDARMYHYIADNGYAPIMHKGKPYYVVSAFYPLYPYLMRIFSFIFKNPILAGFVISNICFLFALQFFYKYLANEYTKKLAFYSCIFLLLFPTSFYFSLVYTESLFFLLLILSFWGLCKKQYHLVFFLGFLLAMTKAVGLFMFFVFSYHFFIKERAYKKPSSYLLTMSPILGFLSTQFLISTYTGDLFSSFKANVFFASQNSIANLFSPLSWFLRNFVNIDLVFHAMNNSLIDRLLFVFYLLTLFQIWINQKREHFILALFLGLLPALMGNFAGYSRYLLVVFPIFIALASFFKESRGGEYKKYLLLLTVCSFTLLQAYLLMRYALFEWVS